MKRTAIYMRVSTDRQAQEGDSIPAQRDALHRYIESHDDLLLAGEYLDDGISGTKEDREELQRMISDVKEGKIDLIIVTKMDRLHRSLRNFLNMQDTLEKHHCDWLAIWEPMYDTSTPQGKMVINTMMSIAQFEAENTAQRIKTVFNFKAASGEVLSGKQPWGYSIVNKHLVPNHHAADVLEFFEHYAMTGKLWETHKMTIEAGFSSSLPNFKRALMNTKYAGFFRGNDHYCPAIVPRDLFDRVQLELKRNIKENSSHEYIFAGLVLCPSCGRLMTGTSIYGYGYKDGERILKKKELGYCCWSARRGMCDNHTHFLERKIEAYLLDNMDDILITIEEEQAPVRDNSKKITALRKKADRLKNLYVNGLISLEEYKTDRERYEQEIADLSAIPVIDTQTIRETLNVSFKGLYVDFTVQEKRYLWRSVIKSITPRRRFPKSRSIICDVVFL